MLDWVKKQDANVFYQEEMHYKHKDSTRLKIKGEKTMYNYTLSSRVWEWQY